MRRALVPVLLAFAVLALPALAPGAAAQSDERTLVMDDENGEFFFHLPGEAERNPTLQVAAGSRVVLRAVNEGSVEHNLHVGPPVERETPCCQAPGERETVEFTVPLDAPVTIPYWCVLHRGEGMEGVLRIAASSGVPRVVIERPAENAVVPPDFTVRVRAENVTLGEDAHLHYTVNGTTGLPGWDTANSTFLVRATGRDFHIVRVELVDAQHRPLDPAVFAERIVFVSPSAPPESPTVTTPTPQEDAEDDGGAFGIPGPAAPLVALALVAAAVLARRR